MVINQRFLKECKNRQDYRPGDLEQKGLYPAEQAIFDNLPSEYCNDDDVEATEEVLKKVIKVVQKEELTLEECEELLAVAEAPSPNTIAAICAINKLDNYFDLALEKAFLLRKYREIGAVKKKKEKIAQFQEATRLASELRLKKERCEKELETRLNFFNETKKSVVAEKIAKRLIAAGKELKRKNSEGFELWVKAKESLILFKQLKSIPLPADEKAAIMGEFDKELDGVVDEIRVKKEWSEVRIDKISKSLNLTLLRNPAPYANFDYNFLENAAWKFVEPFKRIEFSEFKEALKDPFFTTDSSFLAKQQTIFSIFEKIKTCSWLSVIADFWGEDGNVCQDYTLDMSIGTANHSVVSEFPVYYRENYLKWEGLRKDLLDPTGYPTVRLELHEIFIFIVTVFPKESLEINPLLAKGGLLDRIQGEKDEIILKGSISSRNFLGTAEGEKDEIILKKTPLRTDEKVSVADDYLNHFLSTTAIKNPRIFLQTVKIENLIDKESGLFQIFYELYQEKGLLEVAEGIKYRNWNNRKREAKTRLASLGGFDFTKTDYQISNSKNRLRLTLLAKEICYNLTGSDDYFNSQGKEFRDMIIACITNITGRAVDFDIGKKSLEVIKSEIDSFYSISGINGTLNYFSVKTEYTFSFKRGSLEEAFLPISDWVQMASEEFWKVTNEIEVPRDRAQALTQEIFELDDEIDKVEERMNRLNSKQKQLKRTIKNSKLTVSKSPWTIRNFDTPQSRLTWLFFLLIPFLFFFAIFRYWNKFLAWYEAPLAEEDWEWAEEEEEEEE